MWGTSHGVSGATAGAESSPTDTTEPPENARPALATERSIERPRHERSAASRRPSRHSRADVPAAPPRFVPPCLRLQPAVEIVSEHPIGGYPPHFGVVTDVRPHGVVKLGKPVPIVSMSQATADDYTEDVFILAPVGNGTRPVRVDRTAGVEYVMSNIGPCSPGQVAYPIEVAS